MKKTLCCFLSSIILVLSISCSFLALAGTIEDNRYKKASAELQSFAKEVYALTSEYDSDLNDHHNSSDTTEAIGLMSTASVETKFDDDCFETNRLIVYSDKDFDTCNAIEHLSGYKDMHLLQYSNTEDTIEAYEYYCNNEKIDSVKPDAIVTLDGFNKNIAETVSAYDIDYPHDTTLEPSWGYEQIQTYDAFKYILQHNSLEDLPEIVIGIVDDGVFTGNKYFDERLISAYSFVGMNPYSSLSGHGAKVAGVILENTLTNVKIISYQVFKSNGNSTVSLTDIAEEQARLDGVDIINSSYGHRSPIGETSRENTTHIKNDTSLQIAAAGNDGDSVNHYPAANPDVISVAASDEYDRLCSFSTRGQWVDVVAPGARILSAWPAYEGKSYQFDGTSCATPFVASVCAMIMTQYPSFSNSLVANVLFESCKNSNLGVRHGIVNMFNAVTFYDADVRQTATPQFGLAAQPAENQFYTETQYVELTCPDSNAEIYYTLDKTIPSKSNGFLYTKPIEISTTATIYAVAYADEYFKSEVAKRTFLIRIPLSDYPNENGWHIRDNGMIWGYSGSYVDLVIPETVLGIEVKGIESKAFSEQAYIKSITMPDCLTVIEDKAFYKCDSLTSVIAPGVTDIGESAFYACRELDNVFLPKLQTVGKTAFRDCGSLEGFPFENLVKIPRMAFYRSDVFKVNLENATTIQDSAFANCTSLAEVSMPRIDTESNMGSAVFSNCIMLETAEFGENGVYIPEHTFEGCNFSTLDCFDTVETIAAYAFANNDSLTDVSMNSVTIIADSAFENCSNLTSAHFPSVTYIEYCAFKNCSSLSTLTLSDNVSWLGNGAFNGCENLKYLMVNGNVSYDADVFVGSGIERLEMNGVVIASSLPVVENSIIALPSTFEECTEDTKGRNYKVYGTNGTVAEKWAKENRHTFIEVSQETAILKDLPEEYAGNGEALSPDVIGFNCTYQWYSNTVADNTTGTPIEGATNKTFNPSDYPAPYYYCVVTSTDKGFDPVIIKTSACENRAAVADYSKVNEVLSKVPEDLSIYTAESRLNLENAVNAVAWNLNISDQSQVDAMAKAIEEAVAALELMPVDVSMVETVIQMTCGESRKLTVVCDEKVTFESSDTSVATVDKNGVVTAVGKGTATITAAAGDETDTCVVEVKFTVCQLVIHWFKLIIDFIINLFLVVG